jgi:hypothetical protein
MRRKGSIQAANPLRYSARTQAHGTLLVSRAGTRDGGLDQFVLGQREAMHLDAAWQSIMNAVTPRNRPIPPLARPEKPGNAAGTRASFGSFAIGNQAAALA